MDEWFEEGKHEAIKYYGKQIYFVSGIANLFSDAEIGCPYKNISVRGSLELLSTLKVVGLDSETRGTEIWQGQLLLLQLGNKHFEVVIDCTTVDVKLYK